MKRYTQEMVDQALEQVAADGHIERHTAVVLAAEVRALRAEIERWRVAGEKITASSTALMAALARVETALDECAQTEGADEAYVYVYAIRAALRGEP